MIPLLASSHDDVFDNEPAIDISIVNSLDLVDISSEDFDWEEERQPFLRRPFRRVSKNEYELYYVPSVWTERFEQVKNLASFHISV